ncbi:MULTISPECIES: DUF4352 domain-containing protein [Enterococcus]|uniref:DUF4352 domain-containing protein n=1 Tax=Enterococcus TaxID=1350 RepID=UPI000EC3A63E|nr:MULTISPECIES: DUF4352 domain-containing protein [Enterococcus]HCM86751.1 hypothetical protein [Enterococcus sp.]
MNKFRVLSGLVLLSSLLFTVTGCSGGNETKKAEKKENTAQTSKVDLSVEGGSFIIPDGGKVDDETGFLALEIKVKNKSKDKLDVSSNDFALYDEDGKKVSSEHVYDSNDNFKVMSSESLSEDKSFTEPLVFEVKKGAEYELHYKPTYYSDDEKDEGVELKLNTKKYTDETKAVQALMSQYVTKVFYGSDEVKDEDKKAAGKLELANDVDQESKTFKEEAINALKDSFSNYEPSTAELEKVITQIQNTNAEKGKVTYTFKEFFPESAVIYVRPEMVLLDDVDTKAITEKFVEENKGKYTDYTSVRRDAEKYLLQELPAKINETPVNTDENMNGEGYQVKLEKKDGKWEINSANESRNYYFKSMKETFRGGLND